MSHEYKTGDKVRYLNASKHRTDPAYYPEVGTVGTVTIFDEEDTPECMFVQWPEGSTSLDDLWWCHRKDVEPVEDGDA